MPKCKRCGGRAEMGLELHSERSVLVEKSVEEICVLPEMKYMYLHTTNPENDSKGVP